MPPVYRLENVVKTYDGRSVVQLADLQVQPGEILAVVGPSGAGKSTLLRLLNFLEYPTSGRLWFENALITPALSLAERRRVCTVFQHPALLNASVENNVAYGLKLRGQHDSHKVVPAVLERMGLLDLRRAPARTLSAGEAQRVALARALLTRPDVLLLDEPTANLDPYNIGLIEEVVRETNRGQGTTMVLVTHNIFQAKRLAHRTALMLRGEFIEITDTLEFFDHPADERTRAFVAGELIY